VAAAQAVRSRLAVNLLLLAALAALGLLAWFRPNLEETTTYRVSRLDPAQVFSIRIERPGQEPVSLEKRDGEWLMSSPWKARAHELRVERLLEILALSARQRVSAEDLSRFELDRPLATLVANGEVLAVGALNPVTREQYVRAGNWVYLVESGVTADVFAPASRLLSPRLLGPGESPVAFEMGSVSLRQENGKWEQSPPPAEAVSQDDLNRWVQEWRLATALDVQQGPSSGQEQAQGLRVGLAGGRTVPIRVLQREPQVVLMREDDGFAYRFPRDVGARLLTPPG